MSLQIKFKVDRLTADGKRLFLRDVTGNYDAINNPNGYGIPNMERNKLALFCFGKLKTTETDVPLIITDYSPETVEEFEINNNGDGWQEYTVVGIQLYEHNTPDARFAIDEYVYNTEAQLIYRITHLTDNGGSWSYLYLPVEANSEIISQETYKTIVNYPLIEGLCKAHNKVGVKYLKSLMGCATHCIKTDEDAKDLYIQLEVAIQGAINDFGKLAYFEAQKKVEWAQKISTYLN